MPARVIERDLPPPPPRRSWQLPPRSSSLVPVWSIAILTACAAAAPGLAEGLVDLLGVGTAPSLHRAPSLLAYAVASWLVPAMPFLASAHLMRVMLRWRGIRAHVWTSALALGAWVAFGAWIDRRGLVVAPGVGLAAAGVAGGILSLLLRQRASSPRTVALGSVLLLLAAWGGAGAWLSHKGMPLSGTLPEGRHRKNLLLIVADTLREDALSSYGGSTPTPHIDRIGKEGWIIEDAVSTSCWTLPAVASLWTSLEPRHHAVTTFQSFLSPDPPHLAEHLRGEGYVTAAIVANQLLTPARGFARGFDAFEGYTHAVESSLFWVTRLNRLAVEAGWVRGEGAGKKMVLPAWRRGEGIVARLTGYMTAGEVDDAAQDLLDRLDGRDFALWVHYFDPHDPYLLHPTPVLRDAPAFEPRNRERLRERYAGEVAYLDRAVGRLLDEVERRGLLEDTLVVFTADHGEEFLDHGQWTHGRSVYDEVVRIPLMIRFPGGKTPGPAPREASLLDLAPTVLSVMGLPAMEGTDGLDLTLPLPSHRTRFSERIGGMWWMAALRRSGHCALIHGHNAPRWTHEELRALADRVRAAPRRGREKGRTALGPSASPWTFHGGGRPIPVPRAERDVAGWEAARVSMPGGGPPGGGTSVLVMHSRPDDRAPAMDSVPWAPGAAGWASIGLDVEAPPAGGGSTLRVRVQERAGAAAGGAADTRQGGEKPWSWVPEVRIRLQPDHGGRQEIRLPPLRVHEGRSYRLVLRAIDRASAPPSDRGGEGPGETWRIRDIRIDLDDPDLLFPVELYDIASDPHQRHDLAASRPEQAREARREILWYAAGAHPPAERALTPAEAASLRALGYVK